MKPNHLSEPEIQQYALQPQECTEETIAHVQSCRHCHSRVDTYKIIFQRIKEKEVPAFDFDLAGLIIPLIQHKRPNRTFPLVPLVMILAFAVILVSLIFFLMRRKDLSSLWESGNHLAVYTSLTAGILIIVFYVTDLALRCSKQVRKYHLE